MFSKPLILVYVLTVLLELFVGVIIVIKILGMVPWTLVLLIAALFALDAFRRRLKKTAG